MAYARPLLFAKVGVDITPFSWKFPSTPVQPDINSCGLYVARFMEHYNGRFKNEGNWHQVDVMKLEWLRYLCPLVNDKWKKCQHDVAVATNKYEEAMRAEARVRGPWRAQTGICYAISAIYETYDWDTAQSTDPNT
ncbi:hypothetical protein LINPERPRIM_LOCUS2085 [Linum perenne]